MARKGVVRGLFGHKRYEGSAADICAKIVEDCWNGSYFQGSAGHFSQFWARDLGMCSDSLVKLGHIDRVRTSLSWALDVYERNGRITTTIFYGRKAIDIYDFGSDSVPFLIHALRVSGSGDLVKKHIGFLTKEITRYREMIFDDSLGLVKPGRYFPGAKDCMKGSSTVYANTMAAFLSAEIEKIGEVRNVFKNHDFISRMKGAFWRGDHFKDDLSEEDILSADANVWPYWTGVFTDTEMMKKSVDSMIREGLDKPFPIKYTKKRYAEREEFFPWLLTPNYQGNVAWTQVGAAYIDVVRRINPEKAEKYIRQYTALIEKERNYLELFNEDETPYVGRMGFYHADEGMIWASLYLGLVS